DGRLDIFSVIVPRAQLLPRAHRDDCKQEGSYQKRRSHVEFSISLTRWAQPPLAGASSALLSTIISQLSALLVQQPAVGRSVWLDLFQRFLFMAKRQAKAWTLTAPAEMASRV